ncbi:unnamed protein product [Rotaria sordida]|uniref:VWFA domain-containing protein n=1 Tax=Rotaria sordida TaxID=392033 RepID=A0A819MHY6_9BILA|nr:unnamed protein product [Rotaria sordida]
MANNRKTLNWAVSQGANGIESDFQFNDDGNPTIVEHGRGIICDCICPVGKNHICHNGLGGQCQGSKASNDAAAHVQHVARLKGVALFIVDSKVEAKWGGRLIKAGAAIVPFLDKNLFKYGYKGKVVIGTSKINTYDYIQAAVVAANSSTNRERYFFTFDGAGDDYNGAMTILSRLTNNRVYGTGITSCRGETFYGAIEAAVAGKIKAENGLNYIWTLDNESSMQNYINRGVQAHEILFTFSYISDYVNEVLLSYLDYRLDFKSIQKSDFDLVCHRIRPDQVVSLTISDDIDTPGQSELFLSHFQIEQFTRLQSFTLIQIESFRSSFWLEEKRWFVAYQDYCLFSIPQFAPNCIEISQQLRIRSTAPDNKFIYDQINKITMKTAAIKHNHYFTHIKTLELKCSVSLKTVASIIDLNHIKHLTVLSLNDVLKFMPLEHVMPLFCELTIENNVTINIIEQISHYRFLQIRKLEIGVSRKQIDHIIEKLFLLFSCVQHIIYKSPVQTKDIMIHCLASNIKAKNKECPLCRAAIEDSVVQLLAGPIKPSLQRQRQRQQQTLPILPLVINVVPSVEDLIDEVAVRELCDRLASARQAAVVSLNDLDNLPLITASTTLEYGAQFSHEESNIYGFVTLQAPTVLLPAETGSLLSSRVPIDLVCVVDQSGSMSGEKIALLKQTLVYIVEQMNELDRLAIISFNTQAFDRSHGLKRMNQQK